MDEALPRVLIDANIFISYLLPTRKPGIIQTVTEAALGGAFTLLFPLGLARELAEKVATKRYLASRISADTFATFLHLLTSVAETLPPIPDPIPVVTRDRDDDYLLAHALVGEADYLVTGDDDLTPLGRVGKLKIVSPSDFARALNRASEAFE